MKTLLVGAGAIGGTTAVLMKEAGYDIDILEINADRARDIRENGIFLTGVKGDHNVKFDAYGSAEELEGIYDYIIIATKYQALIPAAKSVLHCVGDDTLVVSMQNGICVDSLAELVGQHRAVGIMIGFGATMTSPNHNEMTSLGEFYIGTGDGSHTPQLDTLKQMYDAVLPTQITDKIRDRLWSKLIINSCINSIAAITGETLGSIARDDRAVQIFLKIVREAMTTAKKMGLKVPKYGKLLNYNLLMILDADWYNKAAGILVKMVVKAKYKDVRPSTLQSLERGELTEIDMFNGYIAKHAAGNNVPAPVCDTLTRMVHEIERGERKICVDNLKELEQYL